MFGLVSKRKILREAKRIYLENDTSNAPSNKSFFYCAGNANAISALCARLGINLNKDIEREKTATVSFEVAVEKEGE